MSSPSLSSRLMTLSALPSPEIAATRRVRPGASMVATLTPGKSSTGTKSSRVRRGSPVSFSTAMRVAASATPPDEPNSTPAPETCL